MITSIVIKCPLCEEKSKLYLSINPAVIVLKCPECWTPLMYTKNEIRILSEHELQAIASPRTQPVFNNLFDKVLNRKKILDNYSEFEKALNPLVKKQTANTMAQKRRVVLRSRISPDDIIDLHNELTRCADVRQFLEKV